MLYGVPEDRKTGAMRVRCGYGTGTGRGYGLKTGTVGKLYQYAVPTGHTHVLYPYRTRTQKHVPIPYPYQKHVPTYRTVPNPLGMYTVPPRDAQIQTFDFITLKK